MEMKEIAVRKRIATKRGTSTKNLILTSRNFADDRYSISIDGSDIVLTPGFGSKVNRYLARNELTFAVNKITGIRFDSIEKSSFKCRYDGGNFRLSISQLYGCRDDAVHGFPDTVTFGKTVKPDSDHSIALLKNIKLMRDGFLKSPRTYEGWFDDGAPVQFQSGIAANDKTHDFISATFAHSLARCARHGYDSVDSSGNFFENKAIGISADHFVLDRDQLKSYNDLPFTSHISVTFRLNEEWTHTKTHCPVIIVFHSLDLNQIIAGFAINSEDITSALSARRDGSKTSLSLAKILSIGSEISSMVPHIGWDSYKRALIAHLKGDSTEWDEYEEGKNLRSL